MIIRIRTNLRTLKEDTSDATTVADLIKMIGARLLVVDDSSSFTLSRDIFGNGIISADSQQTLAELGLRHGDEIHLLDRFEYITIEKDYIDENHELVKAGKRTKVIDWFEKRSQTETKESAKAVKALELPAEQNVAKTAANKDLMADLPTPPVEAVDAVEKSNSPVIHERSTGSFAFEDEDIRSPDKIRKLQLIEPMSPSLQRPALTSEDYGQLALLRNQLTAAGLSREEIELLIEEQTEHILSDRAISRMNLNDRLSDSFSAMSSLEELGGFLMSRRMQSTQESRLSTRATVTVDENSTLSSGAAPGRRRFNDMLLQQAGRSVISTNSSREMIHPAIGSLNNTDLSTSQQPGSVPARVTSSSKRNATQPAIESRQSGQGKTPSISAFEQICSNGSELAEAKIEKSTRQPHLPLIRGQERSAAAEGNSQLKANKPASLPAAGIRSRSNSNNSGGGEDKVFEAKSIGTKSVNKGKPIESKSVNKENEKDGKRLLGDNGRISSRPPLVPTAPTTSRVPTKPNPTALKTKAVAAEGESTSTTSVGSTPNSARSISFAGRQVRRPSRTEESVPSTDSGRMQGPNGMEKVSNSALRKVDHHARLLQLRNALEKNIDKQLQREERLVAPTRATHLPAPNNQKKTAVMRNFLAQDSDTALPRDIQQDINRTLEEDLMRLALEESRAMAPTVAPAPRRPVVEPAPNNPRPMPVDLLPTENPQCFYDEEDELLAQALQASMDDF